MSALLANVWARRGLILVSWALITYGLYGWGYAQGQRKEQAANEQRRIAALQKVHKTEIRQVKAADAIKEKVAIAKAKIEWKTEYLLKEVPTYVTVESDRKCIVPNGFVSVWNDASAGDRSEVPPAPRGPVEADSGIDLSTVLKADVTNLGVANQLLTEVKAWRSWYNTMASSEGATDGGRPPVPLL